MPASTIDREYLADPARDTLLSTPGAADSACSVGAMNVQRIGDEVWLTRVLRGPSSGPSPWRGHANVLARYRADGPAPGFEDVFTLRREDARCGRVTWGARGVEGMTFAKIASRYLLIYCALDASGRHARRAPDRWDMWAMWTDDPSHFEPRDAQMVASTPAWEEIRGQAGGRKDPIIVVGEDGEIYLLYTGLPTQGPGTTFRAKWDGKRFVPEAQPLFVAQGWAARWARLTGTVTLGNRNRYNLIDVATRPNTRGIGVVVREPSGGLRGHTFKDEPRRVAAPGPSCRHGTAVNTGKEIWYLYEAQRPTGHRTGAYWARCSEAEFENRAVA
jgi:hypothetical protein